MHETLAELNMKITMFLHSESEFTFILEGTNLFILSLQEQCSFNPKAFEIQQLHAFNTKAPSIS